MTIEAAPLVFIPGSMCDERIYADVAPHFAEPAGPGGQHSAVPTASSIENMAKDVLAEAPDRFVPVGLSLGGIIAAEIVAQAPDRVAGVVLADTNLAVPDEAQLTTRRGWRDEIQAGRAREIAEGGVPALTATPEQHRELIIAMATAIGPEIFLAQNEALLHRRDRRDDLAIDDLPVLLIVGELDTVCPVSLHQELLTRIPGATLCVIPGAGHLSSIDQPAMFTQAIRDWLVATPPTHKEGDTP